MNSVGMCSPLNKLFIESKIVKIGLRDQKLSPFFRGSALLILEILDWPEVSDDIRFGILCHGLKF